ncbi:DUF3667 domain-containing protein [Frateuria hangzhouensis]|uniref:DUF3667 domain-containing protein n=1 Tax=Frateuria hangzhouensis TaxID=2995589 RepID=UPI00226082A5|nr:DUF3667 domain-containing protein [Frateuria sp. STR12]MCX7512737.1 DUF3667 domain-containing protein [Frateuria sp. STR12]
MNELSEAGTLHCANCGTPLEGEFCHHCGQSVHSVLKPVHHMLEDSMDMFLHVDGRIVHTLPPLFTKPGFLTLEYFAGRRQSYVAPFRLMFVLCLLAFFAFHIALEWGVARAEATMQKAQLTVQADAFADADDAAEVRDALRERLDGLATARRTMPGAMSGVLDGKEHELRRLANARLAALGAAPLAADFGAPAPARAVPAVAEEQHLPKVDVPWLPDFADQRLAHLLANVKANVHDAFDDASTPAKRHEARARMITGIFSLLPQAMVVMIPIFALLLKLFYVFRRRLYMEHLIVALHSHAFLFLALLLVGLLSLLSAWLQPYAGWASSGLSNVGAVVLCWMPVYLLIMQKRIYRQGWPMTLLKYWCVGWCYFWLLLAVLGVAMLLGAGH